MKTILKTLALATVLSVCTIAPKNAVAQDEPITLQTFYDQLAPYGQWVNYPAYGYVFIPSVGPGFMPYSTNGYWAYTDAYGWTWASNYPWGWATFHYGRWNYDRNYGWFWVPGLQWAPAWVVWRNANQYYGWAPLPSGVTIGIGISADYGIPADEWCFVPSQYMGEPNISVYCLPRANNDLIIANSIIITGIHYNNAYRYHYFIGPDRWEVERYRHRPIYPVVIRFNSDRHHIYGRGELGIYRPRTIIRHRDNRPTRYIPVRDVPNRGDYYHHRDDYYHHRDQNDHHNPRPNPPHPINTPHNNPPHSIDHTPRNNNNGGSHSSTTTHHNNRGGGHNPGNQHHHR